MVILAFELLYIMRENFFRRFKRYWSAIYAFLFVANVIAVGFVYASETVNNLRTINPYFVAPICEGPFKSFRCGLSSVLLTTAMAFAFLLLFLPLCGCCVSPFYIRFLSTSCHAIVISMLTLVVGWPLSNNVYVTKIVLAIGALSITRIINRFKDFEGETINDQGQTEKSKRVLLSHFLFDFEKYSDYEYEQTRYVV
ncbi:16415_t:CDS:1 [Funneliformis caledonium]|uniref:16415_t:CDS:1 n=1 Tax=Funneliformis caledonium TaxID=1117310 RepID=A0A9N8W1H9_9GLOM|nr:16415_t:CDS:1 [Funneliformis caledonium]